MGKRIDTLKKRISTLEADAKANIQKNADNERDLALERALGFLPWLDDNSRDLARTSYRPLVKRDKDSGEFMIKGVALDDFITVELPDKHPNLLAPKNKTVAASDTQKGAGKPAKPGPIDFDALSATSTKEELAAASKVLAGILAQQN
jgi:hypothetical protein